MWKSILLNEVWHQIESTCKKTTNRNLLNSNKLRNCGKNADTNNLEQGDCESLWPMGETQTNVKEMSITWFGRHGTCKMFYTEFNK